MIAPTYVHEHIPLSNCLIRPLSYRLEYAKKKDKKVQVKFVKDETITKDDVYKSHVVRVPTGEPPSSVSRPPAKRKPGVVRPIASGKLLKAGGPSTVSRLPLFFCKYS